MNIGDQVIYTGRHRDCCAWLPADKKAAVWTIVRGSTKRPGDVIYLTGPGYKRGGQELACYAGDMAPVGPAEPEEYEMWFVD